MKEFKARFPPSHSGFAAPYPFLSLLKVKEPDPHRREREMFGKIRASSCPAESLERPPSKILKDDSLSIYGNTSLFILLLLFLFMIFFCNFNFLGFGLGLWFSPKNSGFRMFWRQIFRRACLWAPFILACQLFDNLLHSRIVSSVATSLTLADI